MLSTVREVLRRLRQVPFAIFMALAFCLLKGLQLQTLSEYSRMLDCHGCLERTAFWRELELLLWLVCADLGARRYLPRYAAAARLLVVGSLLICLLDWWVQTNFQVRLDWREVQKFWGELGSAEFFLRLLGKQQWWMAAFQVCVALVFAASCAIYIFQRAHLPKWCLPGAVFALALCVYISPRPQYHEVYVRHAIAAFFNPPSIHRTYSQSWVEQQAPRLRHLAQERVCAPPQTTGGKPSKVVLLIVESLSSYQSQAYGGVQDWTPNLDRWSTKGRKFTHFLANGKTTEDGLFALLTGQIPVTQDGLRNMYESKLALTRPTLPKILKEAGYHTAFMTSGNLSFMGKHEWLAKVGFHTISGHDAPFYDGLPRYHFDAAWDGALYQQAREWMGQQELPYFLVLETVSSHQPYFDPINQRRSMEGAFRYTDAALGQFLDDLEREGFFSDGLVIVTSDHRAMVPASAQERQEMGDDYLSRVPMLMLGHGVSVQQESGVFSQQDLLPSLQHWLTQQETCLYPGQGLWRLDSAQPAQCVYTLEAPAPSSQFLRCAGKTFEIRLDGENTRYEGQSGAPHYLDALHIQRLALIE